MSAATLHFAAGLATRQTDAMCAHRQLTARISRSTALERAESRGVSADRVPRRASGALEVEASARAVPLESLDCYLWALREGLMLSKLDTETDGDLVRSSR